MNELAIHVGTTRLRDPVRRSPRDSGRRRRVDEAWCCLPGLHGCEGRRRHRAGCEEPGNRVERHISRDADGDDELPEGWQ